MNYYAANVVGLATLNAVLSYFQWTQQEKRVNNSKAIDSGVEAESSPLEDARYTLFKRKFLPVYLLVFGADWLQVHRD